MTQVRRARRTRVLRVIARMNIGGPAYHVSLLSGLLDPERYETLLVTGRVGPGEASMEDLARQYGAHVWHMPTLGPEIDVRADAHALRQLTTLTRRFCPEVVHTHTAKAGMIGRVAARTALGRRPVVVHTFHGHVLEGYFGPARSGVYRGLEKGLARLSDALVGVSRATVDDLVRLGVASHDKFRVIPLGLDLADFLAIDPSPGGPVRHEIGASNQDVVLLFMGRLAPIKRTDLLVRAVATARRRGAPVQLLVAGDGTERATVERLAADLGVSSAIRVLGYRRDLTALVRAADIGVLSSDNEGTPVSLIETAAGARPVVATRVGGVPEVVVEGTGILVAPQDHEAFADALVRLAADPEARRRMGTAARSHVARRHTVGRLIDDIDALYSDLLATRTPRL